jgi:hypothetical protein
MSNLIITHNTNLRIIFQNSTEIQPQMQTQFTPKLDSHTKCLPITKEKMETENKLLF